jgi:hypothetical protein
MNQYYAVLENKVSGPFSVEGLKDFEGKGLVDATTAVCLEGESKWILWKDVAAPTRASSLPPAPSPVELRQSIRRSTAYASARQLILVPAYTLGAIAALCWIALLLAYAGAEIETPKPVLVAASIGATLSTFIFWAAALVGLAVLDAADCALKKDDNR